MLEPALEEAAARRGRPRDDGSCPECEGRGWIVERGRGAGTARPCACRGQGRAERLLAAAGIPDRYRGCRLGNFQTAFVEDKGGRDQLQEAQAICRHYIEGFLTPEGRFRESGLLLVGPAGTGKTHLAVAVLRELVEAYEIEGRFVDFTTLIHQIQATFDPRSPDSKREVLDPVIHARVLVLDELGAQKPSGWVNDILYLVINTRYTRRLPTIFTTNCLVERERRPDRSLDRGADGPDDRRVYLGDRVPAAIVSRLYEMTQSVSFGAVPDFRREIGWRRSRIVP